MCETDCDCVREGTCVCVNGERATEEGREDRNERL